MQDEEAIARASALLDNTIMELLPKTKEAKEIVDLMNRVSMSFNVVLEKNKDGSVPKPKIEVKNSQPKYQINIDPQEFLPKLGILRDELMKLTSAIEDGRDYEIPTAHDPIYLMFDNDYLLGVATSWTELLLFNMDTDVEDMQQEIKNAAVPYNTVGLLKVVWTPIGGPEEADSEKELLEINDENEVNKWIGEPWTYKLEIVMASDLPVLCEQAYVEYTFNGEVFTTEVIQTKSFSPEFNYSHIHHVPKVTEEFIEYLQTCQLEMKVHITQAIKEPKDQVCTTNEIVKESISSGDPKGYDHVTGIDKPKSEVELKCEQLQGALGAALQENEILRLRVAELEARVSTLEAEKSALPEPPLSARRSALEAAIVTDAVIND